MSFSHIPDTNDSTRRLQPKGFMIAPGDIFSPVHGQPNPWTRLNVAYLDDPLLKESLRG